MLKRNKRIITSMALAMIITSTIATTTKALVKDKIQNDSIGCETALRLAKEDRDINSFIKINEVKANDELKCNDIKKAENMIKQIEARNIDVLKRILEMNSRIIRVDNICGYKPICKPTCIKPEIRPVKPVKPVKPTVVKPGKEVKPTVVKPVEEVKPTVIKPIVKPVKPVEEIKPTVVKPSVIKPVEEIKPEVTVNKEIIEEIKTSEKVKINNITNNQEQNQLVKTGNFIDTSLLIKIAGVLSVAGAFLVNKFRK